MNILFLLHGNLACNSASHVDGIARELHELGLRTVVAVPDPADGRERFGAMPYRVVSHEDLLHPDVQGSLFPDGAAPHILHLWTPRERLRRLRERLVRVWPQAKTVLHLEDNEELIARQNLDARGYRLAECDLFPMEHYPESLTHPVRYREFASHLHGATVLIDRLAEHVPPGLPTVTFWPAVDQSIYHPRPRHDALRRELGIADHEVVLSYHGNTHASNFKEVRSVYLAVSLLNRQGVPARLVRLGTTCVPTTSHYEQWAGQYAIEMGYVVDRGRLAELVSLADIFVQPGRAGAFNDYRFPSKLPEFFAMGRPVVLPRTNIGLVAEHGVDAWVLDDANGAALCSAVREIMGDRELYQRLERGALAFYEKHFSWRKSAQTVLDLYRTVTG